MESLGKFVREVAFAILVLAFAYWIAAWGYSVTHPVYYSASQGRYVESGK
jgi:hypothetical protein